MAKRYRVMHNHEISGRQMILPFQTDKEAQTFKEGWLAAMSEVATWRLPRGFTELAEKSFAWVEVDEEK